MLIGGQEIRGKPKKLAITRVDHARKALLANPFYYGVFVHKGEVHQGIHVPMITKQTFDDIQKALVAVGKPRHDRRHGKGFLFLNFARCGSCGYAITAERHIKKRGLRFLYNRCTHKNKKLHFDGRSFVRQEQFCAEVRRNTESVSLSDEWKEKFWAKVDAWSADSSEEKQKYIDRLNADLSALKAREAGHSRSQPPGFQPYPLPEYRVGPLLKIIRFDESGARPAVHAAHNHGVGPWVKVRENR